MQAQRDGQPSQQQPAGSFVKAETQPVSQSSSAAGAQAGLQHAQATELQPVAGPAAEYVTGPSPAAVQELSAQAEWLTLNASNQPMQHDSGAEAAVPGAFLFASVS